MFQIFSSSKFETKTIRYRRLKIYFILKNNNFHRYYSYNSMEWMSELPFTLETSNQSTTSHRFNWDVPRINGYLRNYYLNAIKTALSKVAPNRFQITRGWRANCIRVRFFCLNEWDSWEWYLVVSVFCLLDSVLFFLFWHCYLALNAFAISRRKIFLFNK